MNKSMKQIADELGIDKQRVYRFINKECIKEVAQTSQTKLYDETAQSLIKAHFEADTTSSKSTFHDTDTTSQVYREMVELLKAQIEIKDKQIADLQKANDDLREMAAQSQALHAGTIQTQLLSEQSDRQEPTATDKKRHWWQRKVKDNE